jgi:hypothetical protein
LLAAGYLQALLNQVRDRGVMSQAVEHYQRLAREGNKLAVAQRVLARLADLQLAQRSPAGSGGPMMPGLPSGPPLPGGRPTRPGMPGAVPGPATPTTPAGSSPAEPPAETDPDVVQLQEYLRLLDDVDHCAKASADELEKMYDFVALKAGHVIDLNRLAKQLVTALAERKRNLIQHGISHYDKMLKRDKHSVAALNFLAEAYEWRAIENSANDKKYLNFMALSNEMRDRLAGAEPVKGRKSAAGGNDGNFDPAMPGAVPFGPFPFGRRPGVPRQDADPQPPRRGAKAAK